MKTKEIELSDSKVVIRKLNSRLLLKNGVDLAIFTTKEIVQVEDPTEKIKLWEKLPEEAKKKQIIAMDRIIKAAVITEGFDDEKIENMPDEDYHKIYQEIMDFCFGGKKDLNSFRDVKTADNIGQDGTAVSSTAAPVPGG